jgi:hypothetical protein
MIPKSGLAVFGRDHAQKKGRRSAERRIQPMAACRSTAARHGRVTQNSRNASAYGARSPSGASHAALATDCYPDGSAPDLCFLGLGRVHDPKIMRRLKQPSGYFARLRLSHSSELLADPVVVQDDGAPEPPGNGLRDRARACRISLRSQDRIRNAPSTSEIRY